MPDIKAYKIHVLEGQFEVKRIIDIMFKYFFKKKYHVIPDYRHIFLL